MGIGGRADFLWTLLSRRSIQGDHRDHRRENNTHLPNAPFGAVTDGSLVIKAKCEDIKIKTDSETYHEWKSGEIRGISLTIDDHPLLVHPDADEDCWTHACHGPLEVVLLKLGINFGIVLLRVDRDTYRRVATYTLSRLYAPDYEEIPLDTIHGFEMREVTII